MLMDNQNWTENQEQEPLSTQSYQNAPELLLQPSGVQSVHCLVRFIDNINK